MKTVSLKNCGKKTKLSALLTAAIVLTLLAMTVLQISAATTTYTEGDYTYKLTSSGGAAITKCATTVSGEVVVPSTLGGYNVTELSNNAFYNCSKITKITVPEGVKKLGTSVFWKCTALKSVVFPQTLSVINTKDFDGCTALTSVEFGGVYEIKNYAFLGCTSITSVDLPEGIKTVWEFAFSGCSSLKSISYPSTVKTIEPRVCDTCPAQTTITVDPNNPYFCAVNNVLYNKDMTLLIDVPALYEGAFVIPDTVTEIGKYAFADCNGITSVVIPDNVVTIGWEGFLRCYGLESVTIGNGVTLIDGGAFWDCPNLKSVDMKLGPNAVLATSAFLLCSSLTEVVIPDTVVEIAKQNFSNALSLKKIYIPDSVTVFGEKIFEECPADLVIICSDDSAAAAYADEYGITHIAPGSEMVRGDFDGDGKVASSDAIYLLRSVMLGEESYPLTQSGDVNGDGKTDSTDAIYLLRNILVGGEIYPLA